MASEKFKRLLMTSEMVKKAHYDMRDGQKGSLLLKRWSIRLIMTLEMVKKNAYYDLEMVKRLIMTVTDLPWSEPVDFD